MRASEPLPVALCLCRGASQRDHVECVFGGLNRRRELIAVHAAGLHATFPLDRGLHQGVGLAARRDSHLVIEQLRQLEAELLLDALQGLHESVVAAVAGAGRVNFPVAKADEQRRRRPQAAVADDRVVLHFEHAQVARLQHFGNQERQIRLRDALLLIAELDDAREQLLLLLRRAA